MKKLLILLMVFGCQVDENIIIDSGINDSKIVIDSVKDDLQIDCQSGPEYKSFGEICDKDKRQCLFGFCLFITNLEGVCSRACCEGFMSPCDKPPCPSGWYCMGICIPVVEEKMVFDEEFLKRFESNERFYKTLQVVFPIFQGSKVYSNEFEGATIVEFSLRHGIFGVSCELDSSEDGWWACFTKQNPTKKLKMDSGFINTLKLAAEKWVAKLKGQQEKTFEVEAGSGFIKTLKENAEEWADKLKGQNEK